jgi:hypothetical protein
VNFKPSGIEKYDGSTNPSEWLVVYQLTIEPTNGDSYIMANYLPVYLSSSVSTWLLEFPVGSVHSRSHLCRLFTSNFRTTCAHPGVDWDLANVIYKKGESLREFIQRFCNKRNIIYKKGESLLDHICIFHPLGKHKSQNYDRLQGFIDEVLKTYKAADQEKKPKDPTGDFPEAHKEVNYIYGGPDSYESRRKQKLTAQEVMAVSPATPEYLKWSKVPITFDHREHPDFVPKPGRYPLIVCPIVKDVKLN